MALDRLHILPTHEKVDDGYAYNEKYVGNVYQHKDQIVYFKEKSTIEFPIKIFDTYKDSIIEEIQNIVNNSLNDSEILKSYNESNIQHTTAITNIKSDIDNIERFNNDTIKEFESIKNNSVNKTELAQIISAAIDSKLTDVYNNFNKVTKTLVTDAINEALKDSKRDQSGKLKLTSLSMMKELGYSTEEIVNLSKAGLI